VGGFLLHEIFHETLLMNTRTAQSDFASLGVIEELEDKCLISHDAEGHVIPVSKQSVFEYPRIMTMKF
jgi:hypothetical protein